MAIDGIRNYGVVRPPTGPERAGGTAGVQAPATGSVGGPSFGEALESALKSVDEGMQRGDAQAAAYISGENVDLHNVVLDLERADLGLRTMVQVRNKLLEAYKEVMRMPV